MNAWRSSGDHLSMPKAARRRRPQFATINLKLANVLQAIAPEGLRLEILPIGDLPLYNQDLDTEAPPPSWAAFRNRVRRSDAVLFVTPEYNRSLPAALKNALEVDRGRTEKTFGKTSREPLRALRQACWVDLLQRSISARCWSTSMSPCFPSQRFISAVRTSLSTRPAPSRTRERRPFRAAF